MKVNSNLPPAMAAAPRGKRAGQGAVPARNVRPDYGPAAGKLDAGFARGLLDQSVALFLGGEPEAARLILRDLVAATVGFEALAQRTNKSARSLRGMLSSNGRPGMDSLSMMFGAIRDWLQVRVEVRVVDAAAC